MIRAVAAGVLTFLLFSTADAADPVLSFERKITGLSQPVGIVAAHDGSRRLFIVQQGGLIRVWKNGQLLTQPFLDIHSKISNGSERGLLGLAFSPTYPSSGDFYINYTDTGGDTVVARYAVSSNPDVADAGSEQVLLHISQPFANHNGGQLQFGPDGFLYIGMGDGGSGGDPDNRAQNLSTLLGKMLRIDVVGQNSYRIPPDNPFVAVNGARGEIWSFGLRNPWRFTFDRETGDLWIADVGQGTWEEINFAPLSSGGGENYGWRRMEGSHCFNPATNCQLPELILPVAEYDHGSGCSVTGGFRYRGRTFPHLRGTYLFGDFCSGRIFGLFAEGSGWRMQQLNDTSFGISTFGEDEDGELYLADYNAGVVYQIRDSISLRKRPVRR